MRSLRPLLAVIALLLPRSAPAQTTQSRPREPGGDSLVLKSGRTLAGTLRRDDAGSVAFDDFELGDVVVDRTRVRAVLRHGVEPGIYGSEAPAVAGDEKPPASYVRFEAPKKKQSGSLQTAVTRWHHAETGTTLFLVAAVHVGEPAYYRRLQRILDSTDLVLFEGVGKGKDGKEPTKEDLERFDVIMKLQLMLKDVLALQFQKDGLDYRRSFWKNADVDFSTLTEEMKARGVALPTDNPLYQFLLKLMLGVLDHAHLKDNPALANQLRRQTAPVLAMADRMLNGKSFSGLRSVLIEFRNEATLRVLADELATESAAHKEPVSKEPARAGGRWLSIFYGAGHMPDFQKELAAGGWKFEGADWLEAWVVD